MSYWKGTDDKRAEWPYPIHYDEEQEIETDVLILGGGIAGCWAAISAARKGVRVAIVEKGDTKRSGAGGPGCDHWHCAINNPACPLTPEEFAKALIDNAGSWTCGISTYIKCREGYDTLLEMENMGGEIRDYADEFKGAEFRDEKTKLMFAYDYVNNTCVRVAGTTFKPALKNECERLGVKIFDRVMVTSLLTEGGKQGARIIGATGFNNRTGEFMVFKTKAAVLSTSKAQGIWVFSSETTGIITFRSRAVSGDGTAMAWRAGAELTLMEKSGRLSMGSGYSYPQYGTGNAGNTWYACSIVDANGKEVPWVDRDGRVLKTVSERYRPAPGQKFYLLGGQGPGAPLGETVYEYEPPHVDLASAREGVAKGEYVLPFYADLPGMPEMERKVIFGRMVGQESKTKIPILQTYKKAGFDPNKDLLQSYIMIGGEAIGGTGMAQWRTVDGGSCGGVLVDWDLKTTLDGLYAAGDQLYAAGDHCNAATTGRYAGRKAADYAKKVGETQVSKEQVAREKARIYAPIKRNDGIDWKELHAGIARAMQNYCSEYKTEKLLNMGLSWLKDIEENQVPELYALDPHKLMRSMEDVSILTCAQIIINASLARKASNDYLNFNRIDYPEIDPPEWNKFITLKLEDDKVKIGELPLAYWGSLVENYKAHNKDYTGVYKG